MKKAVKPVAKRLRSPLVQIGILLQTVGTLLLTNVQANLTALNIPPQYIGWTAVLVGTALGVLREFQREDDVP